MKNFPIEHNGQEYWISRSVVCSLYVFAKYAGHWYVLAGKRAQSMRLGGLWNVPGGFLDYHESIIGAAIRECTEETGVPIYKDQYDDPVLYSIDSHPGSKVEHVVLSFYTNMGKVDSLPIIPVWHDTENERVRWMRVDEAMTHQWISDQRSIMHDIFYNRINIKWYQIWKRIKDFGRKTYIYI